MLAQQKGYQMRHRSGNTAWNSLHWRTSSVQQPQFMFHYNRRVLSNVSNWFPLRQTQNYTSQIRTMCCHNTMFVCKCDATACSTIHLILITNALNVSQINIPFCGFALKSHELLWLPCRNQMYIHRIEFQQIYQQKDIQNFAQLVMRMKMCRKPETNFHFV